MTKSNMYIIEFEQIFKYQFSIKCFSSVISKSSVQRKKCSTNASMLQHLLVIACVAYHIEAILLHLYQY